MGPSPGLPTPWGPICSGQQVSSGKPGFGAGGRTSEEAVAATAI